MSDASKDLAREYDRAMSERNVLARLIADEVLAGREVSDYYRASYAAAVADYSAAAVAWFGNESAVTA